MRLTFGTGAVDGGETSCLAAETGVLARGGWNEFCGRAEFKGVLLVLEYAEPTLLGLNTLLGDLMEVGGYKESALPIGGGAGDPGFDIGTRRRLIGGGAADNIGGGGAGSGVIGCSVHLVTSGGGGFSFCFETRWSRNEKAGVAWGGSW